MSCSVSPFANLRGFPLPKLPVLDIKSPRERKYMYFAWKRESSKVQGALVLSSNFKGQ